MVACSRRSNFNELLISFESLLMAPELMAGVVTTLLGGGDSGHWIYKLQSQCAVVHRRQGESHIFTTEAVRKLKLRERYSHGMGNL